MKIRYVFSIFLVVIFSGVSFGQCWEEFQITGYEDADWTTIKFTDTLNGWLFAYDGTLLKTEDGGKNWVLAKKFNSRFLFFPGFILNKDTVFAWSEAQSTVERDTFYFTHNGGNTWDYYIPDIIDNGGMYFLNRNRGILKGRNSDDDVGIFITKDGGKTWRFKQAFVTGLSSYFKNIQWADTLTGWVHNRLMYKTEDGGETWREMNNFPDHFNSILSLHCIDAETCWVLTGRGIGANAENIIFKTEDGGETWNSVTLKTGRQFQRNIHFVSPEIGYTVGDRSSFFKTKNGGVTWKESIPPQKGYIYLDFIEEYYGWVSRSGYPGDRSYIGKYTPVAPTCTDIFYPSAGDTLHSLDSIIWHPSLGCAEGYLISVGYSEDGNELVDNYDVGFDTIYRLNQAVNPDTSLFITLIPYGISGDMPDCAPIAYQTYVTSKTKDFELISGIEVYPNPAKDLLNISFLSKKKSDLILQVVSSTGTEISKARHRLLSGSNSLNIDLTNIASGLYVINLISEHTTKTQKVIIIP